MTALDFLADARRWQGAALLEGLRQAPNRIQFSPVSERAGLATRLAKASPVHALLAVLPDHPGCAAYFKAAYAQNPGLALTWASYAVGCPPWMPSSCWSPSARLSMPKGRDSVGPPFNSLAQ